MKYQLDFSAQHPETFDEPSRRQKAQTAVCVLRDALGSALCDAQLLNVGSSSGIMDAVLAEHCRSVIGIDIDQPAVDYANRRFGSDRLVFELGDAHALRFDDQSFDAAICSQVYEHVHDPSRVLAEIWRVLRPGGVCYFAATNRLILVEPHYRLPFLSWLPRPVANLYVRLLGKDTHYFERLLLLPSLRKLVQQYEIDDYTARIIDQPEKYGFEYAIAAGSLKQKLALTAVRALPFIFPGFVWILRKSVESTAPGSIKIP